MAAYSFSCSNCGYIEDVITRVSYDVHMRMKLFNKELAWDDPDVIDNLKLRSDYYTSDDYFQSSIEEWWDNGCPGCGKKCKVVGKVSVPARHSSWESTGKYGVNGTYNKGLGCVVYSDADMRKKAKAKGLVPADEVAGGSAAWSNMIDDSFNQQVKQATLHEDAMKRMKDSIDKHGDDGRAIAEAFSVEHMKETGALDDKAAE